MIGCRPDSLRLTRGGVSSDYPALLRKNGAVTLDDQTSIWKPDAEPVVLRLVDVPYSWATLPRD